MMTKVRVGLALTGTVLMAASGVVHSLVGWPALHRTLSGTTPAAVIDGLAVPWHFAGLAMILFGVLAAFDVARARRTQRSAPVSTLVGVAYVLFGVAGLVAIKPDATFALFIVPGLLVLAAPR